jgi:hypothetical protein
LKLCQREDWYRAESPTSEEEGASSLSDVFGIRWDIRCTPSMLAMATCPTYPSMVMLSQRLRPESKLYITVEGASLV